MCFLFGGMKYKQQTFNTLANKVGWPGLGLGLGWSFAWLEKARLEPGSALVLPRLH